MAFLDKAGLEHTLTKVLSKVAQSDWSVDNPEDPAYVKNRPFYETPPIETVFIDNETITTSDMYGMIVGFIPMTTIVVGCEYTVTWNGTVYTNTAQSMEGSPYIGNLSIISGVANESYPDTGEPFIMALIDNTGNGDMIVVVYTREAGNYTVSITGIESEIVKIDSKFLPDTIMIGKPGDGAKSVMFNKATAASGDASLAEGTSAASGDYSHAEGGWCESSNTGSHAEGYYSAASGMYSHAEGARTIASGSATHAEGYGSTASAAYAHAEGLYTKASSAHQHVQGKYNIEDSAHKYAHIVGNGDSNKPSNAHTLDWSGNAWYAGTLKLGGTSYTDASEVALKSDLTDVKITVSHATPVNSVRYYPTISTTTDATTNTLSTHNSISATVVAGTTSVLGQTKMILGNDKSRGTDNNSSGTLALYSESAGSGTLIQTKTDNDLIHYLPLTSGTLLDNASSLDVYKLNAAVPVTKGGTGATAAGTTLLSNIGITSGTADAPATGTPGTIYIQYI